MHFLSTIWKQWANEGKSRSFLLDDGEEGGVIPFVSTKTRAPRSDCWEVYYQPLSKLSKSWIRGSLTFHKNVKFSTSEHDQRMKNHLQAQKNS